MGRHCLERSCRSVSAEHQCDRERSKNSLTKSYIVWRHHNKEPQTMLFFFFYLKAVFSTVNIYSFFFNNNKTADKDCLKNYLCVQKCHTRIRSWLLNSLKGNAFSKCAVQKQVHHLACWSRAPRLSPVPRWRTEERLLTDWEVESCPQSLFQDQICIFTCNGYAEDLVSISSAGICA